MPWVIDLTGHDPWALKAVAALRMQGLELREESAPVPGPEVGVILSGRGSTGLSAVLDAVKGCRQRVVVIGPPNASAPLDPWPVLASGASECVAWQPDQGAAAISAWVRREEEIEGILDSRKGCGLLLGASQALRAALRDLVVAARYGRAPILILGETGTGKELAARVAHGLGCRHEGNLVVVDCTTIVPTLLGSELFGHERGAFTGAVSVRTGACSAADQGSLFLDEVGELPLELQPELLRVVQEGTYKRVGGDRWLHSDFRLICATNRDLKSDVAGGRFRADLYHRIAATTVTMPPLRDRREDVLELFTHFCCEAGGAPEGGGNAAAVKLDPAVEYALCNREYPGNLRDLRQLAARVAARHVGPGVITPGDLPVEDRPGTAGHPATVVGGAGTPVAGDPLRAAVAWAVGHGLGLGDIKEGAGDLAVEVALECCGGKVHEAAAMLGVSDRAVQLRLVRKTAGPGARSQGAS